ncbi:MAG: hypothetical protein ACE5G1_07240 [bacterium]
MRTYSVVHRKSIKFYGWIGLLILVVSEFLLIKGNSLIKVWFTPIMWTGYILVIDALIYKFRATSWIMNRPGQFLFMLLYSVGCWLVFEAYNLHLQNWRYVGLLENLWLRYLGYVWAFATIFPGVLLTSELIDMSGMFERLKVRRFKFRKATLYVIILIGAFSLLIPLLLAKEIAVYLFGPVWIGFVFVLDPINYFIGAKSLFRELEEGRLSKLLSLFLAGAICGLLWEFWNYWATAKWVYSLPFLTEPKIFEMPLIGFLGFLPFAVEIYVMWEFAVRILRLKND